MNPCASSSRQGGLKGDVCKSQVYLVPLLFSNKQILSPSSPGPLDLVVPSLAIPAMPLHTPMVVAMDSSSLTLCRRSSSTTNAAAAVLSPLRGAAPVRRLLRTACARRRHAPSIAPSIIASGIAMARSSLSSSIIILDIVMPLCAKPRRTLI